jgi:hypothetical protein
MMPWPFIYGHSNIIIIIIRSTNKTLSCYMQCDELYVGLLIYVQKYGTLHSLFYLEIALHVSSSTTTHHQERKQLYLQHLVFVTPLRLPAAIVEELELV